MTSNVKATVTELAWHAVKSRLIKIFSDNTDTPSSEMNDLKIKSEPILCDQSYMPHVPQNPNCQSHHLEIAQYESNSEDKQYQGEHHNTLFTHNQNQQLRFLTKLKTNPNTDGFSTMPITRKLLQLF